MVSEAETLSRVFLEDDVISSKIQLIFSAFFAFKPSISNVCFIVNVAVGLVVSFVTVDYPLQLVSTQRT